MVLICPPPVCHEQRLAYQKVRRLLLSVVYMSQPASYSWGVYAFGPQWSQVRYPKSPTGILERTNENAGR